MRKRLCGGVAACAIVGLLLVGGSSAATTAKPSVVLKLVSRATSFTPFGFPTNQNQQPPIGASYILHAALFNQVTQFGKPAGAQVGTVEIQCVFASNLRNLCNGVAHVPNGFLTFAGANLINGGPTEWYAVTGGVSGYATSRGQIKATDVGGSNGNKTNVTVTLYN
jgi:hypothetical protein